MKKNFSRKVVSVLFLIASLILLLKPYINRGIMTPTGFSRSFFIILIPNFGDIMYDYDIFFPFLIVSIVFLIQLILDKKLNPKKMLILDSIYFAAFLYVAISSMIPYWIYALDKNYIVLLVVYTIPIVYDITSFKNDNKMLK